jgi:hypothetical protein
VDCGDYLSEERATDCDCGELERDLARMAHDTRPDLDGIDEAVRRIFDTLQRIEEKLDGKQDR